MNEARIAREDRADWETARIVAILANIHGKKKVQPEDFMWNGAAWKARMRAAPAAAKAEGMSGEDIIAQFRRAGVEIIDKRKRITDGSH